MAKKQGLDASDVVFIDRRSVKMLHEAFVECGDDCALCHEDSPKHAEAWAYIERLFGPALVD